MQHVGAEVLDLTIVTITSHESIDRLRQVVAQLFADHRELSSNAATISNLAKKLLATEPVHERLARESQERHKFYLRTKPKPPVELFRTICEWVSKNMASQIPEHELQELLEMCKEATAHHDGFFAASTASRHRDEAMGAALATYVSKQEAFARYDYVSELFVLSIPSVH